MSEDSLLPRGCAWWTLGDVTTNPPEDELFLRRLAEAGYLTFTGPSGLVGATSGGRGVVAIHRGRGKRWHLSFAEDELDVLEALVTQLPQKTEIVSAWLNGDSLEETRKCLGR